MSDTDVNMDGVLTSDSSESGTHKDSVIDFVGSDISISVLRTSHGGKGSSKSVAYVQDSKIQTPNSKTDNRHFLSNIHSRLSNFSMPGSGLSGRLPVGKQILKRKAVDNLVNQEACLQHDRLLMNSVGQIMAQDGQEKVMRCFESACCVHDPVGNRKITLVGESILGLDSHCSSDEDEDESTVVARLLQKYMSCFRPNKKPARVDISSVVGADLAETSTLGSTRRKSYSETPDLSSVVRSTAETSAEQTRKSQAFLETGEQLSKLRDDKMRYRAVQAARLGMQLDALSIESNVGRGRRSEFHWEVDGRTKVK